MISTTPLHHFLCPCIQFVALFTKEKGKGKRKKRERKYAYRRNRYQLLLFWFDSDFVFWFDFCVCVSLCFSVSFFIIIFFSVQLRNAKASPSKNQEINRYNHCLRSWSEGRGKIRRQEKKIIQRFIQYCH